MIKAHSFHIPVMGIGFTIDTPLKVSQFGIDSVISLVDDILIEKMREMYCKKNDMPYIEIDGSNEDYRANRITSYLNLVGSLAKKKFDELRNSAVEKATELRQYFNMLPEDSFLKQEYIKLTNSCQNFNEIIDKIKDKMSMGSIDVNIMTKFDRENYFHGEKLPEEFNDARAALKGFANSELNSSVILSAGLNPRFYSYIDKFDVFFPDIDGNFKKKIVLKVSDFRSALIQGKFLAKKGIWVSEFRIESGLNCGGHAFISDGYLLGPILEEFKNRKDELTSTLSEILLTALKANGKVVPTKELNIKLTVQGGIGTSDEHQFMLDQYKVDSVGWGSPFLLVPEVTNVDEVTLERLLEAKEDKLRLSNTSPMGVPFNTLSNNTKDDEKQTFIDEGTPGSPCTKMFAAVNNEFTERPICTASRRYQALKIKELDKENVDAEQYKLRYDKIVEKSCICVGLGTSALLVNDLNTKIEGSGVSVCPGPNIAYFSQIMSLNEIIDYIYGRNKSLCREDRPNVFINELNLYLNYLSNKLVEVKMNLCDFGKPYFEKFIGNLENGVNYYFNLFKEAANIPKDVAEKSLEYLAECSNTMKSMKKLIDEIAWA